MFKSIYCTRARSCEPGYVLRETKGGRNFSDLYSTVFQDNLSKVNSCVFNVWRLSLRFVKVRAEHDKPGCLFAGSICLSMCVHWQSVTQSMRVHIAHACPTMLLHYPSNYCQCKLKNTSNGGAWLMYWLLLSESPAIGFIQHLTLPRPVFQIVQALKHPPVPSSRHSLPNAIFSDLLVL